MLLRLNWTYPQRTDQRKPLQTIFGNFARDSFQLYSYERVVFFLFLPFLKSTIIPKHFWGLLQKRRKILSRINSTVQTSFQAISNELHQCSEWLPTIPTFSLCSFHVLPNYIIFSSSWQLNSFDYHEWASTSRPWQNNLSLNLLITTYSNTLDIHAEMAILGLAQTILADHTFNPTSTFVLLVAHVAQHQPYLIS